MATRVNPPTLGKEKQYERYKQELLAWREITEVGKNKQGIVIALSLPENDESNIREKVFDQIPIADLKRTDGLDVLLDFLDLHLAKDDLYDSLDKFEDFDDFERSDGQSIIEFISLFDAKYRKIEKKKMPLPPEILAFKLLRKARISKDERLLVLTGMNYEKKDQLYEEAKKSLKKFKGESSGTSNSGGMRFEPAFLAKNEEALLAAGYTRRGNLRGHFSAESCDGRRKGDTEGTGATWYEGATERGGDMETGNASRAQKKINPKGADGKTLICKSCGSYRHLLAACPDSWENMAKVNVAEEEHLVLFTGYRRHGTEEAWHSRFDVEKYAILDSACSSTVCGARWIKRYIESLGNSDKGKVVRANGHKVFKFGGGMKFMSKGEYRLPAYIAGQKVTIVTDVVESDIPLLLSRKSMKRAAVKMDIENDTATILGKEVALHLTALGHYCILISKSAESDLKSLNKVNQDYKVNTFLTSDSERRVMGGKEETRRYDQVKLTSDCHRTNVSFNSRGRRKVVYRTTGNQSQPSKAGFAQTADKNTESVSVEKQKREKEHIKENNFADETPETILGKTKVNQKSWYIGKAHAVDFMTRRRKNGLSRWMPRTN